MHKPERDRDLESLTAGDEEAAGSSLSEQVRRIVAAAEISAAEIRRDMEAHTARRLTEIEAEALADASRIRAEAEAEAADYLARSREGIDAFTESRIRRLTELSDSLSEHAEMVDRRFSGMEKVHRQLYDLIASLGAAAEAVAREAAAPDVPRQAWPPGAPAGSQRANRGEG